MLNYGKLAQQVRDYTPNMPEQLHALLDRLEEVGAALTSGFAKEPKEKRFFIAEIGAKLADAYEVLKFGDDPNDKSFLRDK